MSFPYNRHGKSKNWSQKPTIFISSWTTCYPSPFSPNLQFSSLPPHLLSKYSALSRLFSFWHMLWTPHTLFSSNCFPLTSPFFIHFSPPKFIKMNCRWSENHKSLYTIPWLGDILCNALFCISFLIQTDFLFYVFDPKINYTCIFFIKNTKKKSI